MSTRKQESIEPETIAYFERGIAALQAANTYLDDARGCLSMALLPDKGRRAAISLKEWAAINRAVKNLEAVTARLSRRAQKGAR